MDIQRIRQFVLDEREAAKSDDIIEVLDRILIFIAGLTLEPQELVPPAINTLLTENAALTPGEFTAEGEAEALALKNPLSEYDDIRAKLLGLNGEQYHDLLAYEKMPKQNWPPELRAFVVHMREVNQGITEISTDVAIAAYIKSKR